MLDSELLEGAVDISEGALVTALSIWDIIGIGSTILRFITTPIMVGLHTKNVVDLANYMSVGSEMSYDATFLRWAAGLDQIDLEEDQKNALRKAEKKAIKAYSGKNIFFRNFDEWWDGEIISVVFREKTYYPDNILRTIRQSDRDTADKLEAAWSRRLMFFNIKYSLNRGQVVIKTDMSDVRRIYLKDNGKPEDYVDPYNIDRILEKYTTETPVTLVLKNNNQLIKVPKSETPKEVTFEPIVEIIEPSVPKITQPVVPVENPGTAIDVYRRPPETKYPEPKRRYEDFRRIGVSEIQTQLNYAVGSTAILMFLAML